MKRIKSIIIFCVIFSSAITFAQHKVSFPHIAEMTPNAASICQYQDIPVSYYSGIPQINLPLYEIDIDGFKLPITMNYHASGIKVSQEASWVGLGWSLEIGGSISRSVKNVDDFLQSRIDVEHPYFEKGYYYAPEITDTSLRVDNNLTLIYPNTYEFRSDPTSAGFSESFFNLGAYTLMQIYDSEPDIFFYNLPSMSGKFIFDKSHKAVLFNKEHNLEVRPYYNRNLGKTFFVLKDAEGNTYIFRDVETTKVYRQKGYLNRNGTDRNVYDDTPNDYIGWHESIFEEPEPGPATPYELISNWCLTEIITNTNRHIYFTYEHEEQFMPTQESCELSHFATINGPTPGASRLDYFKSKNINNALRLARIDYDYGHIDFIASTRYDINSSISGRAKKLDQISIYDSNSNLIRYFSFNYSYFNQEHEDDNFCNVFLRLKLDSVTDSQIGKPYTFSYDESHALPAKNSKNTDYWGYYNGKNYGATYYIGTYCNNEKYSGISKDADFDYAVSYTLNGITYPTGGHTQFEYECNQFGPFFFYNTNDDLGTTQNSSSYHGFRSQDRIEINTYNNAGINDWAYEQYPSEDTCHFTIFGPTRLTISCTLDNVSGAKDNSFSYSSYLGRLSKTSPTTNTRYIYSEYPLLFESNGYNNGVGSEIAMNAKQYDLDAGEYVFYTGSLPKEVHACWSLCFDKNYRPGSYNDGTIIPRTEYGGGLRIKSIRTNSTRRNFTYSQGLLLTEPILYYFADRNIQGGIHNCLIQVSEPRTSMSTFNNGISVGYDYVIETTEDDNHCSNVKYYYKNEAECELIDDNFSDGPVNIIYTNGLLERKEVYDNNIIIKENTYNYASTRSERIYAIYDRSQRYLTDEWVAYNYTVEWPQLSNESEAFIDTQGNRREIAKHYTYNCNGLISEETEEDGTSSRTTKIRYPEDFSTNNAVYQCMVDSNYKSCPIEIVQMLNDTVFEADKAIYQHENGLFTILQHQAFASTEPKDENSYKNHYSLMESYCNYDKHGNLREYRNHNQKLVTYLWGYNYHYLIAEIENASFAQIATLLGGERTLEEFLNRQDLEDSEVKQFLSPLYVNRINNTLVKTYTYKPLVGMTSQTDPNGNTTYYEYDSKSRLSEIRDKDRKIIRKYYYHYNN